MEIIEKPNEIAKCKNCKAVIKFSYEDVLGKQSYRHRGGTYFAIICPCCKSIVKVWND